MAASGREHVLSLYRMLLKESKKFPSYNYRTYALRRVRDAFRENRTVGDPKLVEELLNKARDSLAIIQRQELWTDLVSLFPYNSLYPPESWRSDTISSATVIQRSVDSDTSQHTGSRPTALSVTHTHNVPVCVVTPAACVPPSTHTHTTDWRGLMSPALL
ncbi:unnamed protein product [Leuciscus chuanchicus]